MFYTFCQNNSGGYIHYDHDAGISEYVIVEAPDQQTACDRAVVEIGLYFNGCDLELDCECCGDRWYNSPTGTDRPEIYREPPSERHGAVYLHTLDGEFRNIGRPVNED